MTQLSEWSHDLQYSTLAFTELKRVAGEARSDQSTFQIKPSDCPDHIHQIALEVNKFHIKGARRRLLSFNRVEKNKTLRVQGMTLNYTDSSPESRVRRNTPSLQLYLGPLFLKWHHIEFFSRLLVIIFTPPLEQDMTQGQFFKRSLTSFTR